MSARDPDVVRAAVVREPGAGFAIEEVRLLGPGPGQVRVKMAAAGICQSDLSAASGKIQVPFPVVLGHEGAGTVSAVGPGVTCVGVGDRVLLLMRSSCGRCWYCARGEPQLCQRAARGRDTPYGRLPDGTDVYAGFRVAAFGEETITHERNVVPVPEGLPLADVAPLGCAALTGVGAVRNAARVRDGESVAVIGAGGVGLFAVQAARVAGAQPIVAVDLIEARRRLAAELGASHTFAPGPDLRVRIRELTGGRGADYVFDCVGQGATMRLALDAIRRGGHVVAVGIGDHDDRCPVGSDELIRRAATVSGCLYGSWDPATGARLLFDQVLSGRLELANLATRRQGIGALPDAITAAHRREGARQVLIYDN
jgi:S-(hydroxymethyl)glutathione dehydrogenase/alcohol dehydrogenase